jgi:hypothetical protein
MIDDPTFNHDILSYQMKVANNLEIRNIVGLRNNSDFNILKDKTDPAVYVIGITNSVIPKDWSEAIKQIVNKQSLFYKVGTSNTKPCPTYHDYKSGPDSSAMEKSALFGRMQSYCYADGTDYNRLHEYVGMGDTVFAIAAFVQEFDEESRGQLAHKYEQDLLGMIKDRFGHPAGNIKEGSGKSHVQENSLSNIKRLEVLTEKKNGIGTLDAFFMM